MKLEEKFFNAFFYPFLIAILLSSLIITTLIGLFTNNNLLEKTYNNIINLEKKSGKLIINSAQDIVTTSIQKVQASLNEQIAFYQRMANKILESEENYELDTTFLKCSINLDDDYCEDYEEESAYTAIWILDDETTEDNLDDDSKIEVKQQLISYTKIIQNIDACYQTTKPYTLCYYFYFEKTELYISYPIESDCKSEFIYEMKNLSYSDEEAVTCLNENGEYYDVYKVKCEPFFIIMKKSKTGIFDNNYLSNQNRSIYITNYYSDVDDKTDREYTICIEFDDPITKGKAYICADVNNEDMVSSLEILNSDIVGYFFISNVGYNNVFYYPQGTISPRTSTENIYRWDINFYLSEKIDFYNNIRKILSSNYIDYLGSSSYDEIYINGKNSSEQYFFVNEEKLKYSIFPITLRNLNGIYEHIFSIIYVYEDQLFLKDIENSISSIAIKIILEFIIFVIFGSGLLYLIHLTFNILVKYIVIPIKNVNYMLKGINIGGENRLNYVNFLKKNQEENLEKLDKMYPSEINKTNNDNDFNEEIESDLENNNENENTENEKMVNSVNRKDSNKRKINPYNELSKKYDKENEYIEKEINFYNFDEQLLPYRPLEIEKLVKSLMELKDALKVTSEDREIEQIINYSLSENIFQNFKNKEGTNVCQSNIGNLESQLLKFDKAIYHLALSLQDNKLKKFLNINLSDEFDESDSLLNKISYLFNKGKNEFKDNIISIKQMNNLKYNFSQKIIGILINTRYCRLIHSYYTFFKNLIKFKKTNQNIIEQQFMNTTFHTIAYYHKILIQYIYLSYVKNDLVKIGESILDYIEFLIKFKFKTSKDENYFLKSKSKNSHENREKQKIKKKVFDKILSWFNLFDDYISYVKDNSSLIDTKYIIDDYSKNFNSENNEFNLESQSSFMFRVNIQRSEFLKGKFSLCCKNYNDALFYFIRAAKKKSFVIDGLIKKRSLKHLLKLIKKLKKGYEQFQIKNLNMEKELADYQRNKNKLFTKKINNTHKNSNRSKKENDINKITFGEKIKEINEEIIQDINEFDIKQEKDILILIDLNIYNKKEYYIHSIEDKLDAFIDQTLIILNNYLSQNDSLCALIFKKYTKIICPFMPLNKIDKSSVSNNLSYYKNKTLNVEKEEDYKINLDEYNHNDVEFNLGRNYNISENSQEDSFESSELEEENNDNKLKGLVKSINYIANYSKIKDKVINEKYIILFTDLFNVEIIDEEKTEKIFNKLIKDKKISLLLVGKNKKYNTNKEKNDFNDNNIKFEKLILSKYGEKSEIIYFENMKKIKTILSNNNVIKDEIIYPNELYK